LPTGSPVGLFYDRSSAERFGDPPHPNSVLAKKVVNECDHGCSLGFAQSVKLQQQVCLGVINRIKVRRRGMQNNGQSRNQVWIWNPLPKFVTIHPRTSRHRVKSGLDTEFLLRHPGKLPRLFQPLSKYGHFYLRIAKVKIVSV